MNKKITGVHIDLKGVQFKPSYIPQLLTDLGKQKINTVLVEYEDVFPFHGIDVAWDKNTVWSGKTLELFLREAKKNNIEVIPLQQCLGHLEYVFRWNSYRSFAENRKYPGTLCLSNSDGKKLVADMLAQILSAHPDSKYVHLGMDEAHGLATCPKCSKKGDVLSVFLKYLDELCLITERHGKIPVIWSDMVQDHLDPGNPAFEQLKGRVVFCVWEYSAEEERVPFVRLDGGYRISKEWLNDTESRVAPTVSEGTKFIEDANAKIRGMVKPYQKGRTFTALCEVDILKKMGFEVIGASAVRRSADMAVLPDYNAHVRNVRVWASAVRRASALGQIATSWARGTTFCPPGSSIDAQWFTIGETARAMGSKPAPFFSGIPEDTVRRIFSQLGRCKNEWRIEGKIAVEMEKYLPKIKTHKYEWKSVALLARVLQLHRRSEYAQLEVDFFHANNRPVDDEWRRRLDDQRRILREIAVMRRKVRTHFGKRYYGEHFEEWIRDLFDLHERRLKEAGRICRNKLIQTKKIYGH